MSIESAAAFMERVKNDKEFAAKISLFKNCAEILGYAKMSGFDLTEDELRGLDNQLTEIELDQVAGGIPGHLA